MALLDCPLSPYSYEPVAYQSLHAAPCSCSSKHYRRMEWALRINPAIGFPCVSLAPDGVGQRPASLEDQRTAITCHCW